MVHIGKMADSHLRTPFSRKGALSVRVLYPILPVFLGVYGYPEGMKVTIKIQSLVYRGQSAMEPEAQPGKLWV